MRLPLTELMAETALLISWPPLATWHSTTLTTKLEKAAPRLDSIDDLAVVATAARSDGSPEQFCHWPTVVVEPLVVEAWRWRRSESSRALVAASARLLRCVKAMPKGMRSSTLPSTDRGWLTSDACEIWR